MAYTYPGGQPYTSYLINKTNHTKMHLHIGAWDKIFPDPLVGTGPIQERKLKFFKMSDVLPEHRISNKHYLDYLQKTVGLDGDRDNFSKAINRVCVWAGDGEIICVPPSFEHQDFVLTETLMRGEKTGIINHYFLKIDKYRFEFMHRWRIFKLKHFTRHKKKSASRRNWIMTDTPQIMNDVQHDGMQDPGGN